MKSGGAPATKSAAAVTKPFQEKQRKSLHPLQPAATATDKENLVGAGRSLRSSLTGTKKPTPAKNAMSGLKMREDPKKSSALEKPVVKPVEVKPAAKKAVEKQPVKANGNTTKKQPKEGKKEGRIFKDRAAQTEPQEKRKITKEDLTSEAGPSENYWRILAERRRVALDDALQENQMLSEQLKVYKEMLDESRALVEVLQEMIGDDRNSIDNSLDDSRL